MKEKKLEPNAANPSGTFNLTEELLTSRKSGTKMARSFSTSVQSTELAGDVQNNTARFRRELI
jgi:hypothetical protein